MEVHLLDKVNYQTYVTWLDKLYVAARVCYSNKSIRELTIEAFMKSIQQKEKFIEEHIIGPGHWSVLEHVNLTFAFEYVSRAMTHQLVRHRHLSFSQKSQRYADLKEVKLVVPSSFNTESTASSVEAYKEELIKLKNRLSELGFKAEDIRYFYPNCLSTTIVVTGNMRSLFEVMGKRLCSRAQEEIRLCFAGLKKKLEEVLPPDNIFTKNMVPKCKTCQEKQNCELGK